MVSFHRVSVFSYLIIKRIYSTFRFKRGTDFFLNLPALRTQADKRLAGFESAQRHIMAKDRLFAGFQEMCACRESAGLSQQ